MSESFDLVIIGGGPAGQAAAEAVTLYGLSVAVVDEQQQPGGQILRQPNRSIRVNNWLTGTAYKAIKAQLRRFHCLAQVQWLGGLSAIGAEQTEFGFVVHLSGPSYARKVQARYLLVATGCYDMPAPLAGWTTPGVLSAGGLQAFIKAQQIVPGQRFVLAGTHPLQLLVAQQIVAGGGRVAALAFAQSLRTIMGFALRFAGVLLQTPGPFWQAAKAILSLLRSGVRIKISTSLSSIDDNNEVVAVTLRTSRGEISRLDCDRVALCFGFLPQSDLPRALGATAHWNQYAGGWETEHDSWMRTNVEGLFVAGETTGVAGADVALLEGRIAGIGVVLASGKIDAEEALRKSVWSRKELRRLQRFADMLQTISNPLPYLPNVPADTIVCRCEDVSAASIRAAIGPYATANSVKLACRAGMGLCQGRTCEASVLRMIAEGAKADLGHDSGFQPRFPHRPVAVGSLLTEAPDATMFPMTGIEPPNQ